MPDTPKDSSTSGGKPADPTTVRPQPPITGWELLAGRAEAPDLDRDELSNFRHTLFVGAVRFRLVQDATLAELRSAQGTTNQQATEPQVQAFFSMVDKFGQELLPDLYADRTRLLDRWGVCHDMRDINEELTTLQQQFRWTATLRKDEFGKLIRTVRARLQAMRDQNVGTENTKPAEALAMLDRIFNKMQQGKADSLQQNQKLMESADQQKADRDAYVKQLEQERDSYKQENADLRNQLNSDPRSLPYPKASTGQAPRKPGRPNPPNARRNRRPAGQ